jgi:hypothetical protein
MASTITVPDPQRIGWNPQAIVEALADVATAATTDINALQSGGVAGVIPTHGVRGVVTSNIANLAAFTVAGNDGLTYAAGERVLLTAQSTGSQNGIYVVGTVGGGTAALTRATDFDASAEAQPGTLFVATEGTSHADSVWELSTNAAITIGTTALVINKILQNPLAGSTGNTWGVTGSGVAGFSALNLAGGSAYVSGTLPVLNLPLGVTRHARGVVFANVANLAAFTVAGNDGLTYVEGDRVLLANQTTAAQCGLYVVGVVGGGTAALTRVTDMPAAAAIQNGMVVEVSEGTLFAGSSWKAMCTGSAVVGTNDPIFYPRNCRGTATLSSGVKALGATEGLFVLSTTRSSFAVTRNTANTSTGTTGGYAVPVSTVTAGKSGTAAATLTAQAADGTTSASDVSTLHWSCTNW